MRTNVAGLSPDAAPGAAPVCGAAGQPPLAGAAASTEPAAPRIGALMAISFGVMGAAYAFIALAGPVVRQLGLASWHLGLVITLVGVLWTLAAGPWGQRVARHGSPWVLNRAVGGFVLCYLALAAWVGWALHGAASLPPLAWSLGALLLLRVLMGGFMAGVPIAAMSWIGMHTAPAQRASVMARQGAASTSGMVLAPALAGLLGAWSPALALALFGLVPLAGLLWLRGWPPQGTPASAGPGSTASPSAPGRANAPPAPLQLRDARLRRPWLCALLLYSAVTVANVCAGLHLIDALGLAPAQAGAVTGLALAAAGLALTTAQTWVSRHPQVAPQRWLAGGAALGALGFGSVAWLPSAPWLALSFGVAGLGMGLAFPGVAATAANRVTPAEQPGCAAAMAKAQGMSMVAAPLAGSLLHALWPGLPFAGIGLGLLLACGLAATLEPIHPAPRQAQRRDGLT